MRQNNLVISFLVFANIIVTSIFPHMQGWTHLYLEGDCLQVVNALQDNHGDRFYSFGSIISACFALFPLFTVLNFSFIRRLGNCLAHALAHFPSLSDSGLDGISLPAVLANVI